MKVTAFAGFPQRPNLIWWGLGKSGLFSFSLQSDLSVIFIHVGVQLVFSAKCLWQEEKIPLTSSLAKCPWSKVFPFMSDNHRGSSWPCVYGSMKFGNFVSDSKPPGVRWLQSSCCSDVIVFLRSFFFLFFCTACHCNFWNCRRRSCNLGLCIYFENNKPFFTQTFCT